MRLPMLKYVVISARYDYWLFWCDKCTHACQSRTKLWHAWPLAMTMEYQHHRQTGICNSTRISTAPVDSTHHLLNSANGSNSKHLSSDNIQHWGEALAVARKHNHQNNFAAFSRLCAYPARVWLIPGRLMAWWFDNRPPMWSSYLQQGLKACLQWWMPEHTHTCSIVTTITIPV